MKRLISTSILVLAFFSFSIAQESSNPCPIVEITAPTSVQFDEKFKAFASFQKEKQPSISKFDWIVIKEKEFEDKRETARLFSSEIIEVESWVENTGGTIILIAENIDSRCKQVAIAKVYVSPNVGSPLILDEYGKLGWREEKGRLDALVLEMQKYKDAELFAFLSFPKEMTGRVRRSRMTAILNHVTVTRKFNVKSITFLLEDDANALRIWFQPVPQKHTHMFECLGCLVIKGEDFRRLSNLFELK